MKSKFTGEFIDYSTLEDFCGWTGLPLPGESELERGIRAYWNMLSAMMGISALSLMVFIIFSGIIIWLIGLAGGFSENDSS